MIRQISFLTSQGLLIGLSLGIVDRVIESGCTDFFSLSYIIFILGLVVGLTLVGAAALLISILR